MTTLFYPALALQFRRSSTKNNRHTRDTLLGSARDDSFSLLATPWLDNFFPYSQPAIQLPTPTFFWEQSQNLSDGSSIGWVYEEVSERYECHSTGVELVAAPIAWITVNEVLAPNRPGSMDIAGDRSQLEHPESDMERITERVEQVMNNLRSSEEVVSVDCLEVSQRQSGCLADCDTAQSSGVAYFKIHRRALSLRTSKSLEDEWRDANEAIAPNYHGIMLKPTQSAGLDTGCRRIAVYVCLYVSSPKNFTLLTTCQPQSRPTNATDTESNIRESHPAQEIPTAIIILYTVLLAYLLVLLSRATNVHSRFGLAFTGVVELACSSIMSFSVMALLGLGDRTEGNRTGEANVPYYILPFVILIVGVENMSAIVKAVYGIPVSFSVPDRVGLGLAKVGPSMLLTSLSDIGILTIIGGIIKLRPVRDFCIFASILIVVHFWMLITFFLTVLSIDCQRLELDDLLRQISEVPKKLGHAAEQKDLVQLRGEPINRGSRGRSGSAPSEYMSSTWIVSAKKAWKARTARGGSLVLLLTLLTGLYYANESRDVRASLEHLRYTSMGLSHGDAASVRNRADSISQSATWQSIGETQQGQAVFRILPSLRVLLPSLGQMVTPNELIASLPAVSRPRLPRLEPVFRLVKIVILPQCLTAFVVWLILLYLLKDADLLDAQRNKKYAGESTDTAGLTENQLPEDGGAISPARLALQVSSKTVLSAEADIIHVATATDNNIALAITATGQAIVFRPLTDETVPNIAQPRLAFNAITFGALTIDGHYACLVNGSADLIFLDISSPDSPLLVGRVHLDTSSSLPIVDLVVEERRPSEANQKLPQLQACAILSDGSVWIADCRRREGGIRVVAPAELVVFSRFLFKSEMPNAIVISSSTEAVIWQSHTKSGESHWKRVFAYQSAFSAANVTSATVFRACGASYVALGNSKGFLSIYSIETATCVWTGPMSPSRGSMPINHLACRVTPSACCPQCLVKRSTALCIVGSSVDTVWTFRFDVRNEAHDDCTCPSPARQSSGSKASDQLLSVPIKRPTPRRGSRALAGSVNTTGRLSPTSSPGNHVASRDGTTAELSDQSSGYSKAAGVDHHELRSSPNLVEEDASITWTHVDATERDMYRGAFAVLGRHDIFLMLRKQVAMAEKKMDAQWQLLLADSLSAEATDDLEMSLNLKVQTLTRTNPETRNRSLNNHRAQRLAQLDKRKDAADVNVNEPLHQLLAFSHVQACNAGSEDFCLFVTANWVRCYSIKGTIQILQHTDRVARRSTAFHTAPLATPTFVSLRR